MVPSLFYIVIEAVIHINGFFIFGLLYIYKFITGEFLLAESIAAKGIFLTLIASVSFNDGTDICFTIINSFHNLYFLLVLAKDFHIQTKSLQLFQHNLKGFWNTRFRNILTLNDCFICLHTTNAPSTPDIAGVQLEGLHALRNGSACVAALLRTPPLGVC